MARRMRDDGAPKVGELAPNFKLKSLDGTSEVELASFRGRQPVVVFFGSYT
ncbi:MAG: redoxin domain-containing protein [Phycisphaerales bacterium]|nr:MAG: redoxin domain-containing protein [Phycisphaerales bacterium]